MKMCMNCDLMHECYKQILISQYFQKKKIIRETLSGTNPCFLTYSHAMTPFDAPGKEAF